MIRPVLSLTRDKLNSGNSSLKVSTMSLINTQVQPFKANAFVNRAGKGEFIEVSDASLKGKWSVLIFMPAAFTFNCPTEIEDAADNYAEFNEMRKQLRAMYWDGSWYTEKYPWNQ
jgi:alkyl hydroperoxide reductase subunit AhpC